MCVVLGSQSELLVISSEFSNISSYTRISTDKLCFLGELKLI